MAPIPIETTQEVSYFSLTIIPCLFLSLFLLTFLLFKCLRKNNDTTAQLIAASRTSLNTVTNPMNTDTQNIRQTVIIDEPTLKELEENSKPSDAKNVSMMNLLFSNTPQSSGILCENPSVSTENILAPDTLSVPSHSPKISKDPSSDSLHNSTVVENLNTTTEEVLSQDSSVQDNEKDPEYDEVNMANPYAPVLDSKTKTQLKDSPSRRKEKLKLTLSDETSTSKPRSITNPANILTDPPKLPARNLRLGSMPSNTQRPVINKPTVDTGEEVYESIQDDNVGQTASKLSNTIENVIDENAYASVDHDKINLVPNPPSLPAPRLPVLKDTLKVSTQEPKKLRKKNRNSLREKKEYSEPTTPIEPAEDNHPLRKKTKSFAPFTKKAGKKGGTSSEHPQPESPHKSFESSTEVLAKQDRGALPPLPKAIHSESSDGEEGYSCIQSVKNNSTAIKRRESKSSTSSAEGPYSELKFDPKKKRAEEQKAKQEKVAPIQPKQIEDGNTSPMEIDEPYSCIDEVKSHSKDKSPVTPNDPLSDVEISPRALPIEPKDDKIKLPHEYVKAEEIKRRKKEQRDKKEEERRMSGFGLPSQDEPQPSTLIEEKIEEAVVEKPKDENGPRFMSLKSIFSDFRKEEDIVTQTLPHVLGLPPPEPPHDSDDDTHSYASVAKVLEQKRAKKTVPELPTKSEAILTTIPGGIDLIESIGDHTYSTLVECQPYEEPNAMFEGDPMPMYEDIHTDDPNLDGEIEVTSPTYEDVRDDGRFPKEGNNTEVKTPMYEIPKDIFGDEDEPKSKVITEKGKELENTESKVDEKVSQDLSKLREQKGYVKVSHQKDNMPEYASIDDVKSGGATKTKEDSTQNDEVDINHEKFNDEMLINDEKPNDEVVITKEISSDEIVIANEKSSDEILIPNQQSYDEIVIPNEKSGDEILIPNEKSGDEIVITDEKSGDEIVITDEKSNDEITSTNEQASFEKNNPDEHNLEGETPMNNTNENILETPEIVRDSS